MRVTIFIEAGVPMIVGELVTKVGMDFPIASVI